MQTAADLLVVNAGELVTCAGFSHAPARGRAQAELGVIQDGAVAISNGRIAAVGKSAELTRQFAPKTLVDAEQGVVLPGFVDPHTHLVFAGDRAAEWEARMQGVSYLELLRQGGGILTTVGATRAASVTELFESAERWARRCLAHGTTTLEVKSGYCLDRAGELKLLEVAGMLKARLPIEIVPTFLGAHVVPPEYRDERRAYLELVEATQTEVAARGLAEFADVFCETEAFTLDESERLLKHARALGLGVKLHAEQFSTSGAAVLGLELGACSVDHLECISDVDLERLSKHDAPPVAVLLPGVGFHLALDRHAPARRLIEAGTPVALATDFNPGSSFTPSVPMTIALACRSLRMTPAEAIIASTINAAHALGRGALTGSLEPGKRADLVICGVPDHRFLGYGFGWNPVHTVIAKGAVVEQG